MIREQLEARYRRRFLTEIRCELRRHGFKSSERNVSIVAYQMYHRFLRRRGGDITAAEVMRDVLARLAVEGD